MNKKIVLNLLIILSFVALSFAYFVEFILGHKPCNLCKLERIPYIGSLVLISLLIFLNKWEKIIISIVLFLFIFGAVTSVYHVGIEQGIFTESLLCELGLTNNAQGTNELLKTLQKTQISCKDVTFTLLGFSLASINTIFSFLLSCIFIMLFRKYESN